MADQGDQTSHLWPGDQNGAARSSDSGRPRRPLRAVLGAAGIVVVAAASFAAGAAWYRGRSAPGADGNLVTDSSSPAASAGEERSVSPTPGGSHAEHASISGSPATRDLLQERLATVRAATARYRDVATAEADGFRLVVRELPGMGAHFVKVADARSSTFDPTLPNMLLYVREGGGWKLAAVGYILSKQAFPNPPDYFPGAHWHSHQWLCIFPSGSVALMPEGECRNKGGYWVDDTGWMLHVWLYEENPSGVFAELNPRVG